MTKAHAPLSIFTARYKNGRIPHSGLAPVRITLGAPKFSLPYTLAGQVLQLAPAGHLFRIMDRKAFEPLYWKELDRIGIQFIRERFEEILAASGAQGLALLCFEDVSGGKDWCHRLCFAEWWRRNTGEVIAELSESLKPVTIEPPRQATLF